MSCVAILHYAAPPVVGGVEQTIDHHARMLVDAGYRVRVIAGRGAPFHPEVEFVHMPEVDSRSGPVLDIGADLAAGQVTTRFESLREHIFRQLNATLEGVDVLIVHNAVTLHKNMALTAALRKIESRPRLVAWCHDFAWADELYTPDLHDGYPWDLLKTPWPGVRYVAVSEHRRIRLASLLGIPREQIRVVQPGVDPSDFLKLEPTTRDLVVRLQLGTKDPLILLPARITRRKNIELGIRITAEIVGEKPSAALVVTGPPGPHNPKNIAYLEFLIALRDELGVSNNVFFLYQHGEAGKPMRIDDATMSDLYRLADVLLFPSRREGFGIPVLEAGLSRLPVFAADIPPVRESAGDLAFLFDPLGDPQPVAKAILERLAVDPIYRLRRRVLSRFTWQGVFDKDIEPMIKELITNAEIEAQN